MILRGLFAKGVVIAFGFLVLVLSGCQGSDEESPLASVVFDIDGTFTPDPLESSGVRPHAAEAVQAYVSKGYAVIYVTGRLRFQEPSTLEYLRNNGFPDCPLYTSYANPVDSILSPSQVAQYKTQTLFDLIQTENRTFQFGYGDSSTDFEAYRAAFVPPEHVFALLRIPGGVPVPMCQPGDYPPENCLDGYTDRDHLSFIRGLTPVNEGLDNMCGDY